MLFSKATLSVTVTAITLLSSMVGSANAHGFITAIQGANGKVTNGFGVQSAKITPNDQGPTSVFNNPNAACGVGVQAGIINIAQSIEAAIVAGLPTVDATGSISMNWQQVNAGADGGGPGTAEIDITGTGNNFKPLTITKNFGDGGANSANAMTVQLAAGTKCTGGSNKATCLIKVTNAAGPFGSCLAIASPGAAAGGAAAGGRRKANQPRSFSQKARAVRLAYADTE